jgi:hypothetical protein
LPTLQAATVQVFAHNVAVDIKTNSKFFDNCSGNKKLPGDTLIHFSATVQVDANNPLDSVKEIALGFFFDQPATSSVFMNYAIAGTLYAS